MDSMAPKKLALLHILEILQKFSDKTHPLTQEEILFRLQQDYGLALERKAVGRNLSLLKDAGYEITSTGTGCYLSERTFEDSELHLLIDGILASKHINPRHSKELIDKLSALASPSYRKNAKNIYTVNEWDKTESPVLFYTIEMIDEAIETGRQIEYDNKYGSDKKLHRTSHQRHTPYLLILHNQRYYLMSFNEKYKTLSYSRIDRITNIRITEERATDIHTVPGFENGIDYSHLSAGMPYMYSDAPERITFYADEGIVDQIIDWFGKNVAFRHENGRLVATLRASPTAMLYWAVQYADCVEIISPENLRENVINYLNKGLDNYKKGRGSENET